MTAATAVRRASRLFHPNKKLRHPLVMGIVNVTPDSFSDGGFHYDAAAAIAHGLRLVEEGADVLDIGGESTRPGAAAVPAEEELRRVIPVITGLAKAVSVPISVDTAKAAVAEQALAAGASIINDVTALRGDAAMAQTAARGKAAVVLMHMQGNPQSMQRAPRYRDVVAEVADFLRKQALAAQAAGVAHSRIWIDPGIGFGKTLAHNLALMQSLGKLATLGFPVVLGASRKSFIGKLLDAPVEERLAGSLACVAQAARAGCAMVRVHDVKATVDFLKVLEAVERE